MSRYLDLEWAARDAVKAGKRPLYWRIEEEDFDEFFRTYSKRDGTAWLFAGLPVEIVPDGELWKVEMVAMTGTSLETIDVRIH